MHLHARGRCCECWRPWDWRPTAPTSACGSARWHGPTGMGLTGRKTTYFDKARAEHMERVRAMDDLPVQELNPQRSQSHRSLSALRKSQADVEGQGIRRDDQVHGEGAQGGHPCREEGGSAGCQCCSWSHSIGGGPYTRTVGQADFQREDLQGHGQQRWQQNKLLTRSWWQACELSATRARNGTGSLASQSTR